MNRRVFLTRGAAAGLAARGNVFRYGRFTGHADAPDSVAGAQPDAPAEVFREPTYVRTETSGETISWSIGNGLLERTLQYSPAHGLFTETFRHKLSGTDFLIRSLPGIPRVRSSCCRPMRTASGVRGTARRLILR